MMTTETNGADTGPTTTEIELHAFLGTPFAQSVAAEIGADAVKDIFLEGMAVMAALMRPEIEALALCAGVLGGMKKELA